MAFYLRVLALLYFIGGILHWADILDLRLKFSEMDSTWKFWIIYLAIADLIAAVGLWRRVWWGVILFLVISFSQLVAYTLFQEFFGDQVFLIVFHFVALLVYFFLRFRSSELQREIR